MGGTHPGGCETGPEVPAAGGRPDGAATGAVGRSVLIMLLPPRGYLWEFAYSVTNLGSSSFAASGAALMNPASSQSSMVI